MERRERDLNPTALLSDLSAFFTSLKSKANDAIAGWMDGNTKSALDLLKEIVNSAKY